MKPHPFILSVLLLAGCGQNLHLTPLRNSDPQVAIRAALPSTEISHIDCEKITGLCEVVTGRNVFYTTPDGRYLLVGRVFDIEALEDLTEPVLLTLDPGRMLSGAVGNSGEVDNGTRLAPQPRLPQKIAWSDLPKDGAVVWGKMGGRKLAVFSDPKCPIAGDFRRFWKI